MGHEVNTGNTTTKLGDSMDYVKQYFVTKNRIQQCKRELQVLNRQYHEAEQQLRYDGIIPAESLSWQADDLPY